MPHSLKCHSLRRRRSGGVIRVIEVIRAESLSRSYIDRHCQERHWFNLVATAGLLELRLVLKNESKAPSGIGDAVINASLRNYWARNRAECVNWHTQVGGDQPF